MRETLDAIRYLERTVTAAGGLALRYGGLYGSPEDGQLGLVRKRGFPDRRRPVEGPHPHRPSVHRPRLRQADRVGVRRQLLRHACERRAFGADATRERRPSSG